MSTEWGEWEIVASEPVISIEGFSGHGMWISLNMIEGRFRFFGMRMMDAPPHLLRAVCSLLNGWRESTIKFADPPHEWRLVLAREGDILRVRVLFISKLFSHLPDDRGDEKFVGTCPLSEFAHSLQASLYRAPGDQVRKYEIDWGNPYPAEAMNALETLLAERRV